MVTRTILCHIILWLKQQKFTSISWIITCTIMFSRTIIWWISYLSEAIVCWANIGARVLEGDSGYSVLKVGVNESTVSSPFDAVDSRLCIYSTFQLSSVIFLHSKGIFRTDLHSGKIWMVRKIKINFGRFSFKGLEHINLFLCTWFLPRLNETGKKFTS